MASSRDKTGRKMKFSQRDFRHLRLAVRRHPFSNAAQLNVECKMHGSNAVTTRTIRNYLKFLGLKCRVARRKPFVNAFQRHRRVLWAKGLIKKPLSFWKKCLYSDETKICLLGGSLNEKVYRGDGEAELSQHMRGTVKHCPSVTIWACFSYKGVGKLRFVNAKESMNTAWYLTVLENEVLQSLNEHFGSVNHAWFQDDGAPCHRSKSVLARCQQLRIKKLDWVGQSPDCNPIENLWALLKKKVTAANPLTINELKEVVLRVWNSEIPLHYCQALCASMTSRMHSVIKKKGFPSKY